MNETEPITRFFVRSVFGDGIAVWDNEEKKYATRIIKDNPKARELLAEKVADFEAVTAEEWEAREYREIVIEVIEKLG